MSNDRKYKPGQSGNPHTRFKPGNPQRWPPGHSGNPAGIPRSRLQFEESFYAALLDRGTAEEVASLLWESARKREPWAIQAVLQRLAPESKQINVRHGVQNGTNIDPTKLTDEQLDEVQRIIEAASIPVGNGEDREGPPEL